MGRDAVLTNQTVELRVVFEDQEGNLADPDQAPNIYIYDDTYETVDIELEFDTSTFTGLGPFVATKLSTGYYEYVYQVPSGASDGLWHDLWVSERDGAISHEIFNFTVVSETVLSVQTMTTNSLIVVTLAETIADTDGNTLGQEIQLTFSTRYDPLYASAELVRAEVGPWIDFIPDDTLNLLLHWSSKAIDQMVPTSFSRRNTTGCGDTIMVTNSGATNQDRYIFARTMFVIYDTAHRALLLPGAANAGSVTGAGQTKRLGDLSIRGGSGGASGGMLNGEMLGMIRKNRSEWLRVCNARGAILPGEGLGPTYAVKGLMDGDRREAGRLWAPSDSTYYAQPTVNGKGRPCGTRRYKMIYRGR